MENFLSSFEEKSTGQKILIALVGAIGLLVMITILFALTTPKQNLKTGSPSNISSDSLLTNVTNPSPTPISLGKEIDSYSGKGFKITYGSDWEKKILLNNHNELDFISIQKSGGYPNITIAVFTSDPSITFADRFYQFSNFKFKDINATFKGQSARVFYGSVTDSSVGKSIDRKIIIFSKGNLDYLIETDYLIDANKPDSIKEINKVISSFSFQ